MDAKEKGNLLEFLVDTYEDEPVIPELDLALPIVFFCENECKIHETDHFKRVGWCLN